MMQDAIQISPARALASPVPTLARTRRAPPTLMDVLDRTIGVFARCPVSMLACALLCFGFPVLAGVLVYAGLNISVFTKNGNFFTAAPVIYGVQLQVQAILGAVTFLLGRGAIACRVLQVNKQVSVLDADHKTLVSLRAGLTHARQHWRPLLFGTLLHGVLISLALAGLVLLLRELRLDVSNYRYLRADANSVLNMSLVRAITHMPPDPGAPFTEMYAAARYQLSRQSNAYYAWVNLRDLSPRTWIFGVAGAIMLVIIETMLCVRNAVIMQSHQPNASGWLRQTVMLSWRHFGKILIERWSMRILMAVLLGMFVTLPMALHQSVFVTALIREVRAYWPYALYTSLYALVTALFGMLVFAFNTAFDAQLYLALEDDAPQPA